MQSLVDLEVKPNNIYIVTIVDDRAVQLRQTARGPEWNHRRDVLLGLRYRRRARAQQGVPG